MALTDTVIARSDGPNILHVGASESFSSLSAAVAALFAAGGRTFLSGLMLGRGEREGL